MSLVDYFVTVKH